VQLALLVVGLAGCVLLFWHVGVAPVAEALARLSWLLPVVTLVPAAAIVVCETVAWRYAFARDRVALPRLVAVRLAGEAFNHTTPTGNVGGDAVKALLLRPALRFSESVPSLVVTKTSDVVSQAAFVGVGSAVALALLGPESALALTMVAFAVVQTAAAGGFLAVQVRGTVARAERLVSRLGLAAVGLSRFTLFRLDRALVGYYRRRRARFVLSVLWFLLAWVATVLETGVLLALLGVPPSPGTALGATAAVTAATFASFLIPGDVGVHEGAWVLALGAFGVPGELALAVAVAKRLRELVWVAIGYAAWAVLTARPASSHGEPRRRTA